MNTRSVLMIGITLGLANIPAAWAVTGCNNSMLNGRYGVQLAGMATAGAPGDVAGVPTPAASGGSTASVSATPARIAGILSLVLDGAGTAAGNSAVNLGGTFVQGAVSGVYNVNDDCSAAFTLTDANGNAAHFSGIIVGQGSSAFVIQTDAGAGLSGQMQQIRAFCQTADLSGTFGIQYSGTRGAAAVPSTSTGILSLDGQGNISAVESRFNGSSFQPVASTGTISVNPDCSATLKLTAPDGTSVNLMGLVRFDEKQLSILQTDAGTAVTGVVTAQ